MYHKIFKLMNLLFYKNININSNIFDFIFAKFIFRYLCSISKIEDGVI